MIHGSIAQKCSTVRRLVPSLEKSLFPKRPDSDVMVFAGFCPRETTGFRRLRLRIILSTVFCILSSFSEASETGSLEWRKNALRGGVETRQLDCTWPGKVL
jgi:hypothetical protein